MWSFLSTIKQELIYRQDFSSRAEAQTEVFKYLWAYHNPQRSHAMLGFLSPIAYEERNMVTNSSA